MVQRDILQLWWESVASTIDKYVNWSDFNFTPTKHTLNFFVVCNIRCLNNQIFYIIVISGEY